MPAFLGRGKEPNAESNNNQSQALPDDKERANRWPAICGVPLPVDDGRSRRHEPKRDAKERVYASGEDLTVASPFSGVSDPLVGLVPASEISNWSPFDRVGANPASWGIIFILGRVRSATAPLWYIDCSVGSAGYFAGYVHSHPAAAPGEV